MLALSLKYWENKEAAISCLYIPCLSLCWHGPMFSVQFFSWSFAFRSDFCFFHPLHDLLLPDRGLKDNKDDCVGIMWDTQFNHIRCSWVKRKSLMIFWSYNIFSNSSSDKWLRFMFWNLQNHVKRSTTEKNSLRFSAIRILSNIFYFSTKSSR